MQFRGFIILSIGVFLLSGSAVASAQQSDTADKAGAPDAQTRQHDSQQNLQSVTPQDQDTRSKTPKTKPETKPETQPGKKALTDNPDSFFGDIEADAREGNLEQGCTPPEDVA